MSTKENNQMVQDIELFWKCITRRTALRRADTINTRKMKDAMVSSFRKLLCPRYYKVLRMIYVECMSLEEVAKNIMVTKERVRQIKMQAEARLAELHLDLGGFNEE